MRLFVSTRPWRAGAAGVALAGAGWAGMELVPWRIGYSIATAVVAVLFAVGAAGATIYGGGDGDA